MSLIIFSCNGKETETIQLIKEKTGVEIVTGDASYGTYDNATIKFPDMDTPQKVVLRYMNVAGLCMIDTAAHFLEIVDSSNSVRYSAGTDIFDWLNNFVWDINGKLGSLAYSSDYYGTDAFNIPSINAKINENNEIKIIPCYAHAPSGTEEGFVKNVYINYQRMFLPGLRIVDQKGNELMTLGNYLLYKI